jgi:hypothetical protein
MCVSERQVIEHAHTVSPDGLEGAGDLGDAGKVEQADGQIPAGPQFACVVRCVRTTVMAGRDWR